MKWIISNLKMNFTLPEIINYEQDLSKIRTTNKLVVLPSYLYLPYFRGNNYYLGSQGVSPYEKGAYTGQVSAEQLKSLNVKYTIINHPESNEIEVGKQIENLFKYDITPILCISDNTKDKIETKLSNIFKNYNVVKDIILSFEPIESIGTGYLTSTIEIENVIKIIKDWFITNYNKNVPVLYGGSVDTTNIETLNNITTLDGVLLGNTSLEIEKVKEIITKMEVEK